MPGGTPTLIGPFTGGLHNASGRGESIQDTELFELTNFELDPDDHTLVNRPGIKTTISAIPVQSIIIGIYYAPGQNPTILTTNNATITVTDIISGVVLATRAFTGHAGTQFQDRFYMAPSYGKSDGGYFSYVSDTVTWTPVAAIPPGDVMVLFQYRLWVASGDQEPTKTDGTLYWSKEKDGTHWDIPNDGGNALIAPGDGQRLKSIVVMNNDLMLFKEHSTYRFTYSNAPLNAVISKISNTIGAPNFSAVTVYDNNSIFVIHGQDVWQLYGFNFIKISLMLNLEQTIGPNTVNPNLFQCVSIANNRLYLRYWANLYVYGLDTKVWAKIVTTKDFDRVQSCPAMTNTAYQNKAMMTPSGNVRTGLYEMLDDHYSNIAVASGEVFDCSLQTKIFDFDEPWAYKVMFWWGLHIAAAGSVAAQALIPNAIRVIKWGDVANRTWGDGAAYKWGSSTKVVTVAPPPMVSSGEFGRRFIKNKQKLRFRQIYWTIRYTTQYNAEDDAMIRIYSISPVLKSKETVSRTTT